MEPPSTKPYLLRAIHEWCNDNGFTPYIVVSVDKNVRVPPEYVRDKQITLNVSYDATGNLLIDNDRISFRARFGGVARDIAVPVARVAAIYAKENGMGMGFDLEEGKAPEKREAEKSSESTPPSPKGGHPPHLHRVK